MSGNFNTKMKRRPLASPVSPAKNATNEIESNKRKNPKNIFARKFCCCISCNFSDGFFLSPRFIIFLTFQSVVWPCGFPVTKKLQFNSSEVLLVLHM